MRSIEEAGGLGDGKGLRWAVNIAWASWRAVPPVEDCGDKCLGAARRAVIAVHPVTMKCVCCKHSRFIEAIPLTAIAVARLLHSKAGASGIARKGSTRQSSAEMMIERPEGFGAGIKTLLHFTWYISTTLHLDSS